MREVTFDNGHVLNVNVAPFTEAKNLFEAVASELKGIPFNSSTDVLSLFKDLFCTGFSSRLVDAALWPCMARCTYNAGDGANGKVTRTTFEPETTRINYTRVVTEVIKENVGPFAKDLAYLLEQVSSAIGNYQKSSSIENLTT